MQEPLSGHRSAGRVADRALPGLRPVDPVPGLVGTVDLGDLGSLLDAAREGDERTGDPLGEDPASSPLLAAGPRWPAAELAAAAAENMAPARLSATGRLASRRGK